MSNDWVGDSNSIYKTLGASNHTIEDREENDYYATDPKALESLLRVETFSHKIWEPAVGGGHLANVLEKHGYLVTCSDIINRGYKDTKIIDFLSFNGNWNFDIITNPPYSKAIPFLYKGMDILKEHHRFAMFLKVQFLEGGKRGILFEKYKPEKIYIFCDRVECAKNGNFLGGSAIAYAWFIWNKGFKGDTKIDWLWKDENKRNKSYNDLNKELDKYNL